MTAKKKRPVWTPAQRTVLEQIHDDYEVLESLLWGCMILHRERGTFDTIEHFNAAVARGRALADRYAAHAAVEAAVGEGDAR